jgi:hypothetical protein
MKGREDQDRTRTVYWAKTPEPVFLNVSGAQESIPRNEFRQPMKPGGPVR